MNRIGFLSILLRMRATSRRSPHMCRIKIYLRNRNLTSTLTPINNCRTNQPGSIWCLMMIVMRGMKTIPTIIIGHVRRLLFCSRLSISYRWTSFFTRSFNPQQLLEGAFPAVSGAATEQWCSISNTNERTEKERASPVSSVTILTILETCTAFIVEQRCTAAQINKIWVDECLYWVK